MLADKFIEKEKANLGSPYFVENFMLLNGGERKNDTVTFKDNSKVTLDKNVNWIKI
jgi:hypothetical protein